MRPVVASLAENCKLGEAGSVWSNGVGRETEERAQELIQWLHPHKLLLWACSYWHKCTDTNCSQISDSIISVNLNLSGRQRFQQVCWVIGKLSWMGLTSCALLCCARPCRKRQQRRAGTQILTPSPCHEAPILTSSPVSLFSYDTLSTESRRARSRELDLRRTAPSLLGMGSLV